MTEQKTARELDFEVLRRGIEQSDAEVLIGLYADDAEVRIVNRRTPPSSPHVLRGKEIAEHLREGYGMEMEHRVENEVIGENRVAFHIACQYPEGSRVLYAATLEVHDGKVVREVGVEAWDE